MEIIFTTFNARYSHTALALRCLRANLGDLHDRSAILEFDIRLSPQVAAEKILAQNPAIVLFSVYIWNLTLTTETISILKRLRPSLKVVIGGPEVSYDYEDLSLFKKADHLICGEGESIIEQVCRSLLSENPRSRTSATENCRAGAETPPKIIEAPPADLSSIELPYDEYTDEDIAHRRIYVETSRGCPSHCQYCLSALENGIRFQPLERILPDFGKLIERGARIFKFIDRTFNAHVPHAAAILEFFLENRREGMMLHLEWEPHRLPNELYELLAAAPDGFFQLEIGVQTFTPDVAERIDRKLDIPTIGKNIQRLADLPSTHIHADLIAGLPGESMNSLQESFDRLHACRPDEIQLGILKKLRGAPIAQHDLEFEMVYNSAPPYDVLQTSTLSFPELQAVRRFARYWDITVNNGRFPNTAPLIWQDAESVFETFMQWSEWLYEQTGSTAGIAPPRLGRFLRQYLIANGADEKELFQTLENDLSARSSTMQGMERQTRKMRHDA